MNTTTNTATKTINKKTIYNAIKREYKKGREWTRRDNRNEYKLMIDVSTGKIWVDCLLQNNDIVYHDIDCKRLVPYDIIGNGYMNPTIAYYEQCFLEDAIRLLKYENWTITED